MAPIRGERGRLITFEGGEGAGKSTQLKALAATLRAAGEEVEVTREPGGTSGAEAARHAVLSGAAQPLGPIAEAALFAAARADNVERNIRPALRRGTHVLCDRFIDSTRAYQGDLGSAVEHLVRVAIGETEPDLTLVLDLDPELAMRRVLARGQGRDRFEASDLAEHRRRRERFLRIASAEPRRCAVIDASREPDEVRAQVREVVRKRLDLPRADTAEAVA